MFDKITRTIAFILIVLNANAFGDCGKFVEKFDQGFYHPDDLGLDDLIFKVHFGDIEKILDSEKSFGVVKKVVFDLYWTKPDIYKIDVLGLPNGFEERKEQLRQMVRNRLDFVLPEKLAPRLRSYSNTNQVQEKSGDLRCTFEDKTSVRLHNRVEVTFDKKGKLKKFFVSSPDGTTTANSMMSEKSWSKGRWVLDRLTIDSQSPYRMPSRIIHEFEYGAFSGYGFPVKINIETSFGDMTDKKMPVIKSYIEFFDYVINSGNAKRKISQDLDEIKKANTKK